MNQVIFKTNKKQIQILLSASLRQLIRFVANSIFVQKWLFIVTPFHETFSTKKYSPFIYANLTMCFKYGMFSSVLQFRRNITRCIPLQ
jgi:hypothetical protein